jgi:glycosyltransferase involved in cell wall biosynthesis
MIKLIYDYQIFWQQKYGGVSRYFYDLSSRMAEDEDFSVKVLAGLHINQYLKNLNQIKPELVVGTSLPKVPKTGTLLKQINKYFSKTWLAANPPDILHETFYSSDGVAPSHTVTVLTVYDFIYEKFHPESRSVSVKAAAIQRADHIICISENTRNDLLEIFDLEPNKVSVVYEGIGLADAVKNSSQTEANLSPCKLEAPYILFVGHRAGYKNFERFLKAIATSSTLLKDFKIVCFGSVPLHREEMKFANSLGIPEDTLLWFSGSDSLLESFYRGAAALVYPSLYEGFGNPPLEAMSAGCPVICSNTSSMPEVSGDAAEYFNPYEIESMRVAMETVLYDRNRVEDMITRGRERAQLFTLDKCAEQIRDIYLSLV